MPTADPLGIAQDALLFESETTPILRAHKNDARLHCSRAPTTAPRWPQWRLGNRPRISSALGLLPSTNGLGEHISRRSHRYVPARLALDSALLLRSRQSMRAQPRRPLDVHVAVYSHRPASRATSTRVWRPIGEQAARRRADRGSRYATIGHAHAQSRYARVTHGRERPCVTRSLISFSRAAGSTGSAPRRDEPFPVVVFDLDGPLLRGTTVSFARAVARTGGRGFKA